MKVLIAFAFGLIGSSAFGVCVGDVRAGHGGGRTSLAEARLDFTSETTAVYSGPHGSVLLGKKVDLQFSQGPNGFLVADLSTGGHGGETNIFYVKYDAAGNIEFKYFGPYGYRATGLLSCNRM